MVMAVARAVGVVATVTAVALMDYSELVLEKTVIPLSERVFSSRLLGNHRL